MFGETMNVRLSRIVEVIGIASAVAYARFVTETAGIKSAGFNFEFQFCRPLH